MALGEASCGDAPARGRGPAIFVNWTPPHVPKPLGWAAFAVSGADALPVCWRARGSTAVVLGLEITHSSDKVGRPCALVRERTQGMAASTDLTLGARRGAAHRLPSGTAVLGQP